MVQLGEEELAAYGLSNLPMTIYTAWLSQHSKLTGHQILKENHLVFTSSFLQSVFFLLQLAYCGVVGWWDVWVKG